MSAKYTQAELEANMRMKGEGPTDEELIKMQPDIFGPGGKYDLTKKKKPAKKKAAPAKAKKKTK